MTTAVPLPETVDQRLDFRDHSGMARDQATLRWLKPSTCSAEKVPHRAIRKVCQPLAAIPRMGAFTEMTVPKTCLSRPGSPMHHLRTPTAGKRRQRTTRRRMPTWYGFSEDIARREARCRFGRYPPSDGPASASERRRRKPAIRGTVINMAVTKQNVMSATNVGCSSGSSRLEMADTVSTTPTKP